jgi:hypothetical protein
MNPLKRRQSQVPERRRKRTAISEIDQSTAFSRGRTLTGSASSQVHTLSETSADLKSPRVQAHALRKKRRQLIGWLALATALAGLFYILTSQFTAKITVQAAPDPSVQLEPVYTEAIEAYLSDHIGERWRLFTDEAQLTLPPSQINNLPAIIEYTRSQYSRSRADVEASIAEAIKVPQQLQKNKPAQPQNAPKSAAAKPAASPTASAASSDQQSSQAPAQPTKKKRTRSRKKKSGTTSTAPTTAPQAPATEAGDPTELKLR